MGKLARVGIVQGKLVALEQVRRQGSLCLADRFWRKIFEKSGLLEVAERVAQAEELNRSQLIHLVQEATLPILMKLVSLNNRRERIVHPQPIIYLPIADWLTSSGLHNSIDLALKNLSQFTLTDLRVAVDRFNVSLLNRGILRVLKEVMRKRPGLQWVGPSLESIIQEMQKDVGISEEVDARDVDHLLWQMRQAGVTRLRPSRRQYYHALLEEPGLQQGVVTDLDVGHDANSIIEELLAVDALALNAGCIDLWMPGRFSITSGLRKKSGASDVELLRYLAIGSLVLRNVKYIRATTCYFSLQAVKLAPHYGANDLGFGALDTTTALSLDLEPIEQLTKSEPLSP